MRETITQAFITELNKIAASPAFQLQPAAKNHPPEKIIQNKKGYAEGPQYNKRREGYEQLLRRQAATQGGGMKLKGAGMPDNIPISGVKEQAMNAIKKNPRIMHPLSSGIRGVKR